MVGGIRHMRAGMVLALLAGAGLGGPLVVDASDLLRSPLDPVPEPRRRDLTPDPIRDPEPDPCEPTAFDLAATAAAEAKRARRNAKRKREVSA